MRTAWVYVLCALLSLVIAQDSSEDPILLDHQCYAGVFNIFCATISTPDCGQTLNGVYTVDGTHVDTESKNISAIIGSQSGMEKLICQTTAGGACQGCWSVNNVTYVGETQLQTCFSFTIACTGGFAGHNTHDFGCSVIECEEPTTGCPEGFYGADCQISVQDGCISDPTQDPPVNVCVTLPEQLDTPVCNLIANLTSTTESGSTDESWVMSLATSRTIDAGLIYESSTLVPDCPAKFGYHPITTSEERVYGTLYAMLTCVGDGAVYPLLDFSLEIPPGCSDSCGYSTDDASIIPQLAYTIGADQWQYLRLIQAENAPIADLRLEITTNGTLSAVEKWDCRPSMESNDYSITVTGENTLWTLVDSCDTARTQLYGSYYFGFRCDSPEGCDLSYELIVHTIEMVYLASPSSLKPILRADSYQYFQVVAGTDSFDINVYVQTYLGTSVSAGVFLQDLQASGCASTLNNFASTTSPVSTSSDETFDYATYTIHVSPVTESLIGRRISIRVNIHSDCDGHEQSCGYFHLELPYADDPVTYQTEPVTYDTEPVTDGTVPVTDGTVPVTDGTVPVTGATEPVDTTDLSTAVSDGTQVSTNPDEDGTDDYLYYLLFLILAVVGVVCILLIVAVIVAVVVFRIRKRKNTSANFDPTFEGEDAFDSL